MRKQMIENAAFSVATQVRTVEDAIDNLLADVGELQGRMARARGAMGIGPATGQAAFEQLGSAVQALVSARGAVAQCHCELASAKKAIPGLRTVSFGDTECPPDVALGGLRVVA